MQFTIIRVIFFAVLAALVAAAPTSNLENRDVFVPKVLYPHAGTVWYKGQTHNVTWDISNVPKQISNRFSIRLRSDNLITPREFSE
jgi:hypothetical protein